MFYHQSLHSLSISNSFSLWCVCVCRSLNGQKLDDFNAYVWSQFASRLNERMQVSFGEVLHLRAHFPFARSPHTSQRASQLLNDCITRRLLAATTHHDLLMLCAQFKEQQSHLAFFVNKVLTANWPRRNESPIALLEFVLAWHSYLPLLDCHLAFEAATTWKSSVPLSAEWLTAYRQSIALLVSHVDALAVGSCSFDVARLFRAHCHSLARLVAFIVDKRLARFEHFTATTATVNVKECVEWLTSVRVKECVEFERWSTSMRSFVAFCRSFDHNNDNDDADCRRRVDTRVYEQLLERSSHLLATKALKISDVCRILGLREYGSSRVDTYAVDISYFTDIGSAQMRLVEEITALKRSLCAIFDEKFAACLDEMRHRKGSREDEVLDCLSIHQVLHVVWPEARQRWHQLAKAIESGTLPLSEIDRLEAERFATAGGDRMRAELDYACRYFRIDHYKTRMQQLVALDKFKASGAAALAIDCIRERYALSGDGFDALTDLLDMERRRQEVYAKWTLSKMSEPVQAVVDELDMAGRGDELVCLQAFYRAYELVQWLRKNTVYIFDDFKKYKSQSKLW